MNLNKIKNIGYIGILSILIILVVYVTYCSIFKIYAPIENLEPIIIILGTIVMIFALIRLKKLIDKIPESRSNIVAIVLSGLFFIGLCLFGFKFVSVPDYDLSNIIREVPIMLKNGGKIVSDWYFARYTNQVPLVVFIYYVNRIGNIFNLDIKTFSTIINSLCMAITAFFTYLSAKKLKDYKLGLLTLVFFIVNPVFYAYSSYFYSDTINMPFIAIAIYLFIINRSEENLKKKVILEILAGLLFAIGFKIRMTVGIILIAIILVKIFSKESKKIVSCITIILGFLIGLLLCYVLELPTEPPIDEKLEFPITHWLMFGVNYDTNGRWNEADYSYTYNSGTKKLEKNIEKINQRINKMGSDGIVDLIRKKVAVNWSNGDYDYLNKLVNVEKMDNMYEYIAGNRKIFFVYLCQICKTTIMFIFLISLLKEIRNKERINSKYSFIYIAIFGAFIFYFVWEVLTRYSLTFLPWMLLVFGVGIEQIQKLLNLENVKLYFNDKNISFNTNKVKKYFSVLILLFSVFIILINYNKYVIKEKRYYDRSVDQYSSNNSRQDIISRISNKNIKQTFIAYNSFNQVAIRFKKGNSKEETRYNFILKDKDGNELFKQKFSSKGIQNNRYKLFTFQEIKLSVNDKYTIEIYSDDATDENSIGIETFCDEGYDKYPNGELIIDGNQVTGDITFQVQNEIKRSYVSSSFYIVLSFLIILLEIFAFYPFMKYNKKK